MVYVYSVYSKYDSKITKYKYFVRIIQFNFDTYNYEVIFEFPNNDLLSKFENHYEIIDFPRERYIDGVWNQDDESGWLTEIISEKEYLDEIDFIKTNDLMGLSKIFMYAPNNIKFYDIWDEIKYFTLLIHNFYAKTEIDLWNRYFKVMYGSRFREFIFKMIKMFFREEEEIFYEYLSVF